MPPLSKAINLSVFNYKRVIAALEYQWKLEVTLKTRRGQVERASIYMSHLNIHRFLLAERGYFGNMYEFKQERDSDWGDLIKSLNDAI